MKVQESKASCRDKLSLSSQKQLLIDKLANVSYCEFVVFELILGQLFAAFERVIRRSTRRSTRSERAVVVLRRRAPHPGRYVVYATWRTPGSSGERIEALLEGAGELSR